MNRKYNKPTMVYIVQMGDQNIFRVGITTPNRRKDRLRVLQHGNPYKLRVVFAQEVGEDIAPIMETMFHTKLRKYRAEVNDWFHVDLKTIHEVLMNINH